MRNGPRENFCLTLWYGLPGRAYGEHQRNSPAIVRKPEKNSDVSWDTVELLIPGGQFTVWTRKDGTSFPDLNAEPDPDNLYLEGSVTKQFWKNFYCGIEQRRKKSKC
jgi:hypothetical protein